MDGTQWECNSSDTLLNDFFSQDDLKHLRLMPESCWNVRCWYWMIPFML